MRREGDEKEEILSVQVPTQANLRFRGSLKVHYGGPEGTGVYPLSRSARFRRQPFTLGDAIPTVLAAVEVHVCVD